MLLAVREVLPFPVASEALVVHPFQGAWVVQLVNPFQVEPEELVVQSPVDLGVQVVLAVDLVAVAAWFHHRFLHSFSFLQMAWDILPTLLEAV